MIRVPTPGKLLFAALAVSATVAAVAPASAETIIVHRHPAMRVFHGPRCFVQRTVTRGPMGGRHVVVRRVCR
jgi:hypothetical protein